MSIQSAYDDWSSSYDEDQNLTRDLDGQALTQFLAGSHFGSVLEAGCGTGKNTAFLAGIGGRVMGTDFSPGMLQRARRKVSSPNVRFLMSDLTAPWPFDGSAFDLLTFDLVLEHIQDLSFVFSEAARVMKDAGNLFVSELHPFRQYMGKQAAFARQEPVTIPAFIHHISDFIQSAAAQGLVLNRFLEFWHQQDAGKPPRLAVFLFTKSPRR